MSQSRENLRTDGRMDGETLFYKKNLPAEAEGPTTSLQQVTGGNTPNLILKRMLRHFQILELLDKLQKRICRIIGPSLVASLEALPHRRNVASLSLFYRYYFGRCFSELGQLVPLPFSRGRSTRYSDRLHDFSITIPRCYKDVYVNSFFPRTAKLWNSLPIECFPLTYDLSGFVSRIKEHLLTVDSF